MEQLDRFYDVGYVIDQIYAKILGVDILGVDIWEVDILGVDISGVDILGVDILGRTHQISHVWQRTNF